MANLERVKPLRLTAQVLKQQKLKGKEKVFFAGSAGTSGAISLQVAHTLKTILSTVLVLVIVAAKQMIH